MKISITPQALANRTLLCSFRRRCETAVAVCDAGRVPRASLPERKRHAKDPLWPLLAVVEEAGGRRAAGCKGRSWPGQNFVAAAAAAAAGARVTRMSLLWPGWRSWQTGATPRYGTDDYATAGNGPTRQSGAWDSELPRASRHGMCKVIAETNPCSFFSVIVCATR
jgi:hypothetical protein